MGSVSRKQMNLAAWVALLPISLFAAPKIDIPGTFKTVHLLDSYGHERAPKHPVTGRTPFGVLAILRGSGKSAEMTGCSLSHVYPGMAATHTSCFKGGIDRENYYVLYYDHSGRKQYAQVDAVRPGTSSDRVGWVALDYKVRTGWDALFDNKSDFESAPQNLKSHLSVHIWAWEPGTLHPLKARAYNPATNVMVFQRYHCQASLKKPLVTAKEKTPYKGSKQDVGRVSIEHGTNQMTVDSCDSFPSHAMPHGGLVTVVGERVAIGTLSGHLSNRDFLQGVKKKAPNKPSIQRPRDYQFYSEQRNGSPRLFDPQAVGTLTAFAATFDTAFVQWQKVQAVQPKPTTQPPVQAPPVQAAPALEQRSAVIKARRPPAAKTRDGLK